MSFRGVFIVVALSMAMIVWAFVFRSRRPRVEEATQLQPDEAYAHVKLGAILCDEKHDYDGAIAEFRAAIRLKPDFAVAHFNLGNALLHKGRSDDAIVEF